VSSVYYIWKIYKISKTDQIFDFCLVVSEAWWCMEKLEEMENKLLENAESPSDMEDSGNYYHQKIWNIVMCPVDVVVYTPNMF